MYVYSLADPDTGAVRYVGKTVWDPARRLRKHLADARSGRACHIHHWLQTLPTLPTIGILDRAVCAWQLDALEQEWIRYGRQLGWDLVNQTDGGTGGDPGPVGREKISQLNRGRVITPAHRAKLSKAGKGKPAWNKGVPHSAASRQLMSKAHQGRQFTEEHRARIQAALKAYHAAHPGANSRPGRPHSEATRAKLSAAARRRKPRPQTAETRAKISASKKRTREDAPKLD